MTQLVAHIQHELAYHFIPTLIATTRTSSHSLIPLLLISSHSPLSRLDQQAMVVPDQWRSRVPFQFSTVAPETPTPDAHTHAPHATPAPAAAAAPKDAASKEGHSQATTTSDAQAAAMKVSQSYPNIHPLIRPLVYLLIHLLIYIPYMRL